MTQAIPSQVTFYACVESLFTLDDPVGDLITLLSSNMLPSPSSRLVQDPLEQMCLIDYCDQHTLAHGKTFPLAFSYLDNKSLPPALLGTLATLANIRNYLYGDSLGNQCSFCTSDQLPTQHSLGNLHVPILEDIEEETIFYYSDGGGYDSKDVLVEIELCMPFGTQLFPHHDDSCPQPYLCEVVTSSRKICFRDGEPLPATTKEPYVGESVGDEPNCFRSPKGPTTDFAGFILDTSSLN